MNLFMNENLNEVDLKRGEVLFRDGDLAEKYYLVLSGKICNFKLSNSRVIPLYSSSEKELVGEEIILNDKPYYSYYSVAMEDSTVVEISKSDVFDSLNEKSEWMLDILKGISSKLINTQETVYEHKIVDGKLLAMDTLTEEDEILLKSCL